MFEDAITTLTKNTKKIVFVAADKNLLNVHFIKGDKLQRTALIVKADLQQWINLYKRQGYV